jgi:predicted Rossmann fold flavoprotein
MKSVLKTDVLVIGAGPAGMMASFQLAQRGFSVILADKQARPGIKLLMTGNGRCNISNTLAMEFWEEMIPRNPRFLKTAFNAFSNEDLRKWLKTFHINLIADEQGRLFPESNSAKTIVSLFESQLFRTGVNIIQQRLTSLQIHQNTIQGAAHDDGFMVACSNVIVACGGKSWPQTGSNGEGYALAEQVGHRIIEPRPSLCPLMIANTPFSDLAGTSISKAGIRLLDEKDNELKHSEGPLMITHQGISGPIVLNISAYLPIQMLKPPKVMIDWLPDYSDEAIQNFWSKCSHSKSMKQWLIELKVLPQRFSQWFFKDFSNWQDIHPMLWSKKERYRLLDMLKRYSCDIDPMTSFDEGMVTSGGVSVQEVSPKTMQSKKCKGLYFAGEVLDVDALSGGFNIHIALATGYLAGISAQGPCL